MIEIKNISKKIGSNKILDNISFAVNQGEILGFLGPNGAGKTTTMKIITSFWAPDSGEVMVGGSNVVKDSLKTRTMIGYLPENVPLYDDMKVYEYLKFVGEVRGISKNRIKQRIKEVIEACGLKSVIRKPVEELSKGFRQRLGLAQAIINNPDVLILDEPTTGLDPNQIVEIRDLIKRIGKEKTVIFSTHILSEASAICDRVVIINNGQIVGEGTPEELTRKASPRQLLYVKIKGFPEEVMKKLKEMPDIISIKIKDREAERIIGYDIEVREGVDIRENLSRLITHRGWSILEFNKTGTNLEDVFRELTK